MQCQCSHSRRIEMYTAKHLYRFLTACSGNWRNSIYISSDGPSYLLSADRDARPVIMSTERFQSLTAASFPKMHSERCTHNITSGKCLQQKTGPFRDPAGIPLFTKSSRKIAFERCVIKVTGIYRNRTGSIWPCPLHYPKTYLTIKKRSVLNETSQHQVSLLRCSGPPPSCLCSLR